MLHTRTRVLPRTDTAYNNSNVRVAKLLNCSVTMPFAKVFRRVQTLTVDSTAGSSLASVVASATTESLQVSTHQTQNPTCAQGSSSNMPLKLRLGSCQLPHPDKASYGGEDAYFVTDLGGGAIGIADGVGGWQESGVNPAEYSRTLMLNARAFLEKTEKFATADKAASSTVLIDPKGALAAAHQYTKVPGSATACVLQLDQANSSLIAANLGDSGFLIVRDNKVLLRSRPLQHYFDCPLQFGAFPEFVEATDTADQAEMYNVKLFPGDVIIAGTDGLWDNVYENEILELAPKDSRDVDSAANLLATLARSHAGDHEFASPYTKEAVSQGLDLPWWEKLLGASYKNGKFQLKQLTGGKMDDITVVVAYVETQQANTGSSGDQNSNTAAVPQDTTARIEGKGEKLASAGVAS